MSGHNPIGPSGPVRPVRSFVLRQGRISNAQQRAMLLMPKYGIAFRHGPLDLDRIFGRSAATFLEIGFGMGETTAAVAKAHPECNYIGVEVHTPGVGALLKRIEELGLTNLRVIQHDVVEVFQHALPPACLDGVHIFFPDPWPKKRHHKRRLIQPGFVALVCRHLKPGGYLHVATDWENYAEQILEVLSAEAQLVNTEAGYAPHPEYRPMTKFEQRGLMLGHEVRDLIFRKR